MKYEKCLLSARMGFRGDLGVSRAQNKLQGPLFLLHMYPLLPYNMWQYPYHNTIQY